MVDRCSSPSRTKYLRKICRCDSCREKSNEYQRDYSKNRYLVDRPNGWDVKREEDRKNIVTDCGNASNSTYTNHKCRCDACRFAYRMNSYNRRKLKADRDSEYIKWKITVR